MKVALYDDPTTEEECEDSGCPACDYFHRHCDSYEEGSIAFLRYTDGTLHRCERMYDGGLIFCHLTTDDQIAAEIAAWEETAS